jgi:hypothetical protein
MSPMRSSCEPLIVPDEDTFSEEKELSEVIY